MMERIIDMSHTFPIAVEKLESFPVRVVAIEQT
jgi:kynurenine formamidase